MRRWIAGIIAAFSLSAVPAVACTCGGPNRGACQVPSADTIVLARVISIEQPQYPRPPATTGRAPADRATPAYRSLPFLPPPWGSVTVTLQVTERFRGNAADTLLVRTELSPESCGYPFVAGAEYLVFASEFEGNLAVTSCSATQPAPAAASRIRQLRGLRDQTPLPDLFGFVGTFPEEPAEIPADAAQPVPGLTVTAHSDSGDYRTQTAADGSFEFHGVPRGRYQVSVAAPAGRRALWGGAERVGANAGLEITCPLDFLVFWDGRIRGAVAGRDGQPVSGFISARYIGPEPLHVAPVTAIVKAGRFEVLRLRPGQYRLQFHADQRPPTPPFDFPGTVDVFEGSHVEDLHLTVF